MHKHFLLFFTLICFSLSGKEYPYELSCTAIFRDEAPFLREWVEYHRMMGVEHFYLYDHLSTDHPEEILAPYIECGIVELEKVTDKAESLVIWNRVQSKAYNDAISKAKDTSRWLAVIDLDEYIVPVEGDDIPSLLRDYLGHGAVAINWQLFGTSHVEKIKEDELMTEMLTMKAEKNYPENKFVKLIINPSLTVRMKGPHTCVFSVKTNAVGTDFKPVSGKQTRYVVIDKLQLNHYWCKDEFFYHNVKMKRNKNMGSWLTHMMKKLEELNSVEDTTILRFTPALKERVFSDGVYFD